jgi:hypothetical protein
VPLLGLADLLEGSTLVGMGYSVGMAILLGGVTLLLGGVANLLAGVMGILAGVAFLLCGEAALLGGVAVLGDWSWYGAYVGRLDRWLIARQANNQAATAGAGPGP